MKKARSVGIREWTAKKGQNLSRLLKDLRHQTGLSQRHLARASGVAARTVAALEATADHRPRADVLLKLASGLGADPKDLMYCAGYSNVQKHQLRKMTAGRYPARRELDPEQFFRSIEQAISPSNPVLFCVAYSAPPGSAHRADVKSLLVRLIDRGMWLAMVVPYPLVGAEETTKPNLVNYYRYVYGQVVATASELLRQTSPEKRRQIAVFIPSIRDKATETLFVMPPISSTESRSSLIKWYESEDEQNDFELGAWVTFAHDQTDRWYTVYSRRRGQHVGGDDLTILPAWKDYFRDIISKCDPKTGKSWPDEVGMWRRVAVAVS